MPDASRSIPEIITARRSMARRLRAGLRDTGVLVREFRLTLALFVLIELVGAITFQALWNASQPEPIRFVEALYDMLTMTFFQPVIDFPDHWFLDIYFFIMPTLGLALLAQGAAEFVTLLFNRSARLGRWEEAVAAMLKDHIIVCGLGHLGVRVVRELVALNEDIVAVEKDADSPRIGQVRSWNVPVIIGDARQSNVLESAGIDRASAIIVCTNDDLMNLQMGSRIRQHNPHIRMVMRIFDEDFARNMADHLNVDVVMSASMMAAPAFAGAASRAEIVQTFKVDDRVLVMGRIEVNAGSRLDGAEIARIEKDLDLSVVLLQSSTGVDVRPAGAVIVRPGDVISVVSTPSALKTLSAQWNRRA